MREYITVTIRKDKIYFDEFVFDGEQPCYSESISYPLSQDGWVDLMTHLANITKQRGSCHIEWRTSGWKEDRYDCHSDRWVE